MMYIVTTLKGWFSDAYHSLTEGGQQSLPLQPTVSHLWEMPTGTMLFFSGIMFARFGTVAHRKPIFVFNTRIT